MTVGDVLDGAWQLTRAVARPFVVLSLVVGVPFAVAGSPSPFAGGGLDPGATSDLVVDGALLGLVGVVALVQALVVSPLQYTAAAWLMSEAELGRSHGWLEAFRFGLRRFPRALGSTMLVALAMLVPLVGIGALVAVGGTVVGDGRMAPLLVVPLLLLLGLSILPAMALAYTWGLGAVAAQTVEDLGAVRSVRRMWGLVRTRPLGLVWTGFVAGIVVVVLSGVLTGIAAAPLALGADRFLVRVLSGVLQAAAAGLVVPFTMGVGLLLYVDARIRSEGFDLQVRAAGRG